MPDRTHQKRKQTTSDDDDGQQQYAKRQSTRTEAHGFSFETREAPADLSISPIETSKDKIEQPELAKHKDMFIPPLGSSIVISGKSGSGKSTLLANLITDARFYGPGPSKPNGWFDKIFLFSPTANGDDVQRALGIPPNHVFTDLEEAPELLDIILNSQQSKIDKSAADQVEQYAIIFDDVIGDTKFMNEKSFTKCFYQVRHVNCTTFICTQHFKRVPKICRLQANFVFFFQGGANEVEVVVEDFAPPEYSKNEFRRLVCDATRDKFSFLTINNKVGWDKRFRHNLDTFIRLDRLEADSYDADNDDSSSDDKENKTDTAQNDTKYYEDDKKQKQAYADSIDVILNDRNSGLDLKNYNSSAKVNHVTDE